MPKLSNANLFNEPDSAANLAVVGLGPGGLAAALEASMNGNPVIAFTDRDEYIRGQRVLLTPYTIRFLKQYIDLSDKKDNEFWLKYCEEETIQTKDIERFLYRKLRERQNVTIVHIDKRKGESIQLVGSEEGVNFIQLSDNTRYYCKNILAADGAKHGFADIINNSLKTEIIYTKSPVQERHPYHAVVQLKLKEGEQRSSPAKLGIMSKMNFLSRQQWKHTYQPKNYVFSNAKGTKFYFAGEIPEHIFNEKDDTIRSELLKTWASRFIYEKQGVKASQLEYRTSKNTPAKDHLQCSAFKMDMMVCKQPLVELEQGVFAQIGDARRTPNYNLAHGINDAIRGGIAFSSSITSQGFQKERFINVLNAMDFSVESRMKAMQEDGAFNKELNEISLLNAINQLITHVQKEPNNTELVQTLRNAKEMLRDQDNISALYDALTEIQPIANIHKNDGLLYQALRWLLSIFNEKAALTKTAIILEEVKSALEDYSNRPVL